MCQAGALGGRASLGRQALGPFPAPRSLSSEGGPALAGFQGWWSWAWCLCLIYTTEGL